MNRRGAMRAPFTYYGSKSTIAPWIVAMMPPHRVYIELFAGSAAVLFAKPPSTHEILVDIDRNVVTFFRVLREQPAELARICRLTPYSRQEYRDSRLTDDVNDLERARRFWLRCCQSYNGVGSSGSRSGAWSAGARQGKSKAAVAADTADRLEAVAERLRRVMIDDRGYRRALELYDEPDAVIYADPPYLGSTRSSLERRARDYGHDLTTEDDHRELAATLHGCKGTVILSGYSSSLYAELFADWHTYSVSVHRSSGNRRGEGGGQRTEVLWANRPLAGQASMLTLDGTIAASS